MPAAHINVDEFLANYPRYLNRPGGKILSGTDSYKTYCSAIRQFLEWCDARAIIPLEVDDYQAGEYIDWIEKQHHYTTNTMATKRTGISKFYEAAVRLHLIEQNPFSDITIKSETERQVRFFTPEEIYLIIEVFDQEEDQFKRTRNLAMLYLMGVEGLRNVEVHRMNREDINWKDGTIKIYGKGHNRYIYPCVDTLERLEGYIHICPLPKETAPTPVFISESNAWNGCRLSRDGIRYIMNKAEKMAGLKQNGTSCHILRHSVGTNLYAQTKDLRLVQDTLGHRDPQTTAIYAHLNDRLENRYTKGIVPVPAQGPKKS